MNYPKDFPADQRQIGVMSIDTVAMTIYIDMWGERVRIAGRTSWPLDGPDWDDMLKRHGLVTKRGKGRSSQTSVNRLDYA